MKKTIIFGGTTEGRQLAEARAAAGEKIWVSVATPYGRELLPQGDGIQVRVGRMNQEEMEEYLHQEGFEEAVDATHPYATQVSRNLAAACQRAGVCYRRLERGAAEETGCILARDAGHAAELCQGLPGNILLTTGAKELEVFCTQELRGRLYPRVLPVGESVEKCRRLGVEASHIIAMQGPFSTGFNLALMRELDIKVLVTKDGGQAGGLPEKLAAARAAGVTAVMIQRPV